MVLHHGNLEDSFLHIVVPEAQQGLVRILREKDGELPGKHAQRQRLRGCILKKADVLFGGERKGLFVQRQGQPVDLLAARQDQL